MVIRVSWGYNEMIWICYPGGPVSQEERQQIPGGGPSMVSFKSDRSLMGYM